VNPLAGWVIDQLRSSVLSLNIFSAYLRSRVLGASPSLQDRWTALQIISLLLHAEREPGSGKGRSSGGDMASVQSILLNLIAGADCLVCLLSLKLIEFFFSSKIFQLIDLFYLFFNVQTE
jgi:hypothetical protein